MSTLSAFVGREHEIREIVELLERPGVRLLSIVGPGGMGKTRLALQLVSRVADGAYFVALDGLHDASALLPAIALTIGFKGTDFSPPRLTGYLRDRSMLLVLDNFEHLLDGATLLTEILQATTNVKILTTSRERLNLQEETVFRIEGLTTDAAVELFLQQARRLLPDYRVEDTQQIVRICRLVEGMPLAILLAAGWVDVLPLDDIAAEIARSLDVLETQTRNIPERHRSIQAAFNASWKQLSAVDQRALSWLSVFRGGFTREAAQQVAGVNLRTLANLTAKSFLRHVPESGRYEIHALLRLYASERLVDAQAAHTAHMNYFLGGGSADCGICTDQRPLLNPLTEREHEVLLLIAAGLNNHEIADELFVSISTVKKHINHIYSKLNVDSRTRALVHAQELGLL